MKNEKDTEKRIGAKEQRSCPCSCSYCNSYSNPYSNYKSRQRQKPKQKQYHGRSIVRMILLFILLSGIIVLAMSVDLGGVVDLGNEAELVVNVEEYEVVNLHYRYKKSNIITPPDNRPSMNRETLPHYVVVAPSDSD